MQCINIMIFNLQWYQNEINTIITIKLPTICSLTKAPTKTESTSIKYDGRKKMGGAYAFDCRTRPKFLFYKVNHQNFSFAEPRQFSQNPYHKMHFQTYESAHWQTDRRTNVLCSRAHHILLGVTNAIVNISIKMVRKQLKDTSGVEER